MIMNRDDPYLRGICLNCLESFGNEPIIDKTVEHILSLAIELSKFQQGKVDLDILTSKTANALNMMYQLTYLIEEEGNENVMALMDDFMRVGLHCVEMKLNDSE